MTLLILFRGYSLSKQHAFDINVQTLLK